MGFRSNDSERYGYTSNVNDRRASARYEARGTNIVMEWVEGEEPHSASATLKDISLSGVLAEMVSGPPPGTVARLRLGNETVEGMVTRVSRVLGPKKSRWSRLPAPELGYLISLSFPEVCPYDFFKTATEGLIVDRRCTEDADPRFNSRDWR